MFTVSDRLRDLRYWILTQDPAEFKYTDLNPFGQELNEFRTILARLANVHNGTGKIVGWGHLEGSVPASYYARQAEPPPAQAADDDSEIVIPDDDEPRPRRSSRTRAS